MTSSALLLREVLSSRGLASVSALARRVGVDQSYLAHILAGRKRLTPGLTGKLRQALHITADEVRVLFAPEAGR